jgi:hypothetical protein
MNNKLSKILTIVVGLIGLIGFYFFVRILYFGDDAVKNDAAIQAQTVGPFVNFSIAILIITMVITIVFSLTNLVKDTQVLKRTLMGLGLFGVLLILSYVFASDGAVYSMGKVLEGGEAGSVSKWVSTGINFSAILGAIGLGAFLFDFVKSLVKN